MKKILIYKEDGDFVIERINQFDHATKRTFLSEEGLFEGLQDYLDVLQEYDLDVSEELWAKVIQFLSTPEKRSRDQISVLFTLHKKMYDVRWNGANGTPEELEKEFILLAKQNGVHQEVVNTMMEQLYIPPYKENDLPDYLKAHSHGGRREGAGRPPMGTTRKVSITLPDEVWEEIEKKKGNKTMAAYLRSVILQKS
jgi:hypothetical protein